MSVYPYLNLQKSKSSYKTEENIPVVIFYYYKGRKMKISTRVMVKLKDWNSGSENPVRRSDLDYKIKNLTIRQKVIEVENIIQKIVLSNQIPDVQLVKIKLGDLDKERVVNTKKDFDFFLLRKDYELLVLSDVRYTKNYRKNVVTSLNQISEFINENTERKYFPLNYFFDDFQLKYMNFSVKKKNRSNPTIAKHLKHLRGFISWCYKNGYIEKRLDPLPITTNFDKEVIYLTREELLKLHDFSDFNFDNPNHINYTKEYFTDKLKNNTIVNYTNLEVYNDMLVFGCGLGCRFNDLINLKLDNYEFGNDRTHGYFVFRMSKSRTGKKVRVPINMLTFNIWKKYSKNKTRFDYIFPRTQSGNLISNQKMNKHLKVIGEIVGLTRWVQNPSYTSEGKVKEGTDIRQPLYRFLTSHIIRRTFIREGINNNIPYHVIMSMSGHTDDKVFKGYFSTIDEELDNSGKKMFSLVKVDVEKEIETPFYTNSSEKELRKKLSELKSLFQDELIPEELYNKRVSEILKTNT